jgi:hypothetical protein
MWQKCELQGGFAFIRLALATPMFKNSCYFSYTDFQLLYPSAFLDAPVSRRAHRNRQGVQTFDRFPRRLPAGARI